MCVVFRSDRKNKIAAALPLISWYIFDFSSKTTEHISTKLDTKQDLNVLYHVCDFRADQKNKMASWPLMRWDSFDFSVEAAEQNSTKLERMQDLNVLCQVVFYTPIWMAVMVYN